MAYTPTEWKSGDVITAEKLNNIEDGVQNGNSIFVITFAPNSPYTPDKTFEELVEAVSNDKLVLAKRDASGGSGWAILHYQLANMCPKGTSRFADFIVSQIVGGKGGSLKGEMIHWYETNDTWTVDIY